MTSIQRIFPALFAVALVTGCQNTTDIAQVATSSGPYEDTDWIRAGDNRRFSKLHEVVAQADFEFYLDHDDLLAPMGGSHTTTIKLPSAITHNVAGHRDFSGFIVVQILKLAQTEEVDELVMRVNKFFFAQGADRVLVTGFYGNGRAIYSDRIKKPNKPAHPTAGNVPI